jgi:formate-nitrite transporter family protein
MSENDDPEARPSPQLSDEELEDVAQRRAGSARVIHEVIRIQGREELERPWVSLGTSALAAGVAIGASVLAQSIISAALPAAPWRPLVSAFGYSIGFLIVILGNLQLFTENTITAVLPVATHPTRRNLGNLVRLWSVVLSCNLAGTLALGLLFARGAVLPPEHVRAIVDFAAEAIAHDALDVFLRGIPAGFLVASIAWILPNARESAFWIVVAITWTIAVGGFTHVVAGSAEAWTALFAGRTSLMGVLGYILPALAGNVLGGTGLFTVLAHAQVRNEISTG